MCRSEMSVFSEISFRVAAPEAMASTTRRTFSRLSAWGISIEVRVRFAIGRVDTTIARKIAQGSLDPSSFW